MTPRRALMRLLAQAPRMCILLTVLAGFGLFTTCVEGWQ